MQDLYQIKFFETANGNRPVEEYLEKLRLSNNPKDRDLYMDIAAFIKALAKRGNSLGMPFVRKLKGTELWELGPKSERIIYCMIQGNEIYLLHAFTKDSQKTRLKEIKTAQQRYKLLLRQ